MPNLQEILASKRANSTLPILDLPPSSNPDLIPVLATWYLTSSISLSDYHLLQDFFDCRSACLPEDDIELPLSLASAVFSFWYPKIGLSALAHEHPITNKLQKLLMIRRFITASHCPIIERYIMK